MALSEARVRQAEAATSGDASAVAAYLAALHARYDDVDDGEVASYIPELSRVDPSLFGICLATVDGAVYAAGDTDVPLTLQSMSKPLTYGLALERLGTDAVRDRIGVEPSGDAFNELSLSAETGMPRNPLINAGAIACAGLVAESTSDPYGVMTASYSRCVGHHLELDAAVYLSESRTGHRNRGMAHILKNYGVIDDPDAALDLYFRQCSISVDCRDLAVIGATLANGGVNPCTGERAIDEAVVRDVLSVMATCGMYDFAGEWLVSVGLPAKSGVSGGVIAVLPGRLGIGVFSPRLDAQGNSVRGIAVCRDLSLDLSVHLVRPGERPAPAVRARYTPAERGSKRVRSEPDRAAIRAAALQAVVIELQGELGFSASEALVRHVDDTIPRPELVVVDLRRIVRVDSGGIRLLVSLAERIDERGGTLALASGNGTSEQLREALGARAAFFPDLDVALEWCEDELLRRTGEAADITEVLVIRGSLSVLREGPDGRGHRTTTLSAGMTFGELAFVDRGVRAADVRADSEVECRTLPYATIDRLAGSDPVVHGKLLRNLLGVVVRTLLVVNGEVTHLTS